LLKKREALVEVGAEATEEETGEVKVREARAEAMIEEGKKNQEKDLQRQMIEIEAGQMTERKRNQNKEVWIEEARKNPRERGLALQMTRAEMREPGQMTELGLKTKPRMVKKEDHTQEVPGVVMILEKNKRINKIAKIFGVFLKKIYFTFLKIVSIHVIQYF